MRFLHYILDVIRFTPLAFAIIGCGAMGNVLIPHHDNSMVDQNVLVCFKTTRPGDSVPPFIAAIPGKAVDLLIAEVAKGIEKESERYKATYSGRNIGVFSLRESELLFITFETPAPKGCGELQDVQWDNNISSSIGEMKDWPAVNNVFIVKILAASSRAIRLVPQYVALKTSKSKVAWATSPYPWHWPAAIVWGPWYLFDRDIAKVDTNVQISLKAVATDEKTGNKLVDMGTVDFPLGKRLISDPFFKEKESLESLGSGWIPLPPYDPKAANPIIPMDITVTVIESNDLGDVIAKGATQFKEKKDDIGDSIKRYLGVEN
jgi:hypothetical protein